jgi:uncharacterized membrane protein
MNGVVMSRPGPGGHSTMDDGPRVLTHVLYGLHTLSWFSLGVFSVIAMVINYVKRDELPNDFYTSHFRWQSRSFWVTLAALLLTLPLWLLFVFPGWAAWTLIGFWYLYRFVRGWWAFAENRPMPMATP